MNRSTFSLTVGSYHSVRPSPFSTRYDIRADSLSNQLEICREYAEDNDFAVVGQSSDDNISGMRFDRFGISSLSAAVEAGKIDAVIVKDLSRLGRHRTQTALFIDYLRQYNVAVLSVTERLNTLVDEDDLIIGAKGLMNDLYAKDISKKIRAGYRQKQQKGLVITPPFGYMKDRNSGSIVLNTEAAETVRLIFALYLQGESQKSIAKTLTEQGKLTPAQTRDMRRGWEFSHTAWNYASIKNILTDESYTGVLINHKRETRGQKTTYISSDDWLRHEDFYPVIIERGQWEQAQRMLKANSRKYYSNKPKHRYAGLLSCGDCGEPFVAVIRSFNGRSRVEYVCNGYHRKGRSACLPHRLHEEYIDEQVLLYIQALRNDLSAELDEFKGIAGLYDLNRPGIQARTDDLKAEIREKEDEIEALVMMRISDLHERA